MNIIKILISTLFFILSNFSLIDASRETAKNEVNDNTAKSLRPKQTQKNSNPQKNFNPQKYSNPQKSSDYYSQKDSTIASRREKLVNYDYKPLKVGRGRTETNANSEIKKQSKNELSEIFSKNKEPESINLNVLKGINCEKSKNLMGDKASKTQQTSHEIVDKTINNDSVIPACGVLNFKGSSSAAFRSKSDNIKKLMSESSLTESEKQWAMMNSFAAREKNDSGVLSLPPKASSGELQFDKEKPKTKQIYQPTLINETKNYETSFRMSPSQELTQTETPNNDYHIPNKPSKSKINKMFKNKLKLGRGHRPHSDPMVGQKVSNLGYVSSGSSTPRLERSSHPSRQVSISSEQDIYSDNCSPKLKFLEENASEKIENRSLNKGENYILKLDLENNFEKEPNLENESVVNKPNAEISPEKPHHFKSKYTTSSGEARKKTDDFNNVILWTNAVKGQSFLPNQFINSAINIRNYKDIKEIVQFAEMARDWIPPTVREPMICAFKKEFDNDRKNRELQEILRTGIYKDNRPPPKVELRVDFLREARNLYAYNAAEFYKEFSKIQIPNVKVFFAFICQELDMVNRRKIFPTSLDIDLIFWRAELFLKKKIVTFGDTKPLYYRKNVSDV